MGGFLTAAAKFIGAIFFGAGAGASAAYVLAVNVARIATLAIAAKLTAPSFDLTESAQEKTFTVRDPIAPQRFVYGEDMVSGPIIYSNLSGAEGRDLWVWIALAGHEIDSFQSYRFDDTNIALTDLDGSGNITSGKFDDVAVIATQLGTSTQVVPTALNAAFAEINTNHRARGWATLLTKLSLVEGKTDAFENGAPQNLRAVLRGRKVYDPRDGAQIIDDESTWVWSDNPALCLADFLRWQKFGLGESHERIDWPKVITAANICDQTVTVPGGGTQKRYTINATFDSVMAKRDVRNLIVAAMLGRLVFSQGKWKMWAGAAITADVTLNENNVRKGGGIQLQVSKSARERFNRVRGKFVDASRDYTASTYPEVRSATFLAEDNNEVRYLTADFPTANNEYEAQRDAIVTLKASRNQRVLTFEGNLSCFRVQPGTVVLLDVAEFGFNGEKFFVTEWSMTQDFNINLTLVEEDDTAWDDPLEAEYSTRTPTGALVFGSVGVPAPDNLTATGVLDGVFLEWTNPPATMFDHIEIWGSDTNSRAAATLIGTSTSTTFFETLVDRRRNRYYWIRSVNTHGQVSDWEPNLTTTTATDSPEPPSDNLVKDPDFDFSTGLGSTQNWDGDGFDNTTPGATPTSIAFFSTGGANNGPYVKFTIGSPSETISGDKAHIFLFSNHGIRSITHSYVAHIRYRRNHAGAVSDEFFKIAMRGTATKVNGAMTSDEIGSFFTLPDTGGDWTDVVVPLKPSGTLTSKYWKVRLDYNLPHLGVGNFVVDIDSIYIYAAPADFASTEVNGNKIAGLVPQSSVSGDSGKFLRADGTWQPVSAGGGGDAVKANNEVITGSWTLDGAVNTSDFGTGGRVKDGTDVSRPIGFNVMPVYEIDADDSFDLAHVGMIWHKDANLNVTFTCADDATIPRGATYVVANEDLESVFIAQGTGVTLRWFDGTGGAPPTGTRTLVRGGVCTVYKYTDTEFWIWGNQGLS